MSEENKQTNKQPALPSACPVGRAGRHPTTSNKKDEERQGEQEMAEEGLGEDKELEAMENKYLRALADYQNLLKQTAREKEEFAKYANERLVLEILPVFDNLKLARKHTEETPSNGESLLEGVSHIINQFTKALKDAGVEEIKTVGEKFDHDTMEALESEEADDKKKDGVVARKIAAGYKLNGKVIKAARVAVYKKK